MSAPVKCPHCRWWVLAPFRHNGCIWEFHCWNCAAWLPWRAIAGS